MEVGCYTGSVYELRKRSGTLPLAVGIPHKAPFHITYHFNGIVTDSRTGTGQLLIKASEGGV